MIRARRPGGRLSVGTIVTIGESSTAIYRRFLDSTRAPLQEVREGNRHKLKYSVGQIRGVFYNGQIDNGSASMSGSQVTFDKFLWMCQSQTMQSVLLTLQCRACTALPQLCTACEIKLNQLPCSSNHSKLVLIQFTCL